MSVCVCRMLVPTAPICHAVCNCFTQVDKMDQWMRGEGGGEGRNRSVRDSYSLGNRSSGSGSGSGLETVVNLSWIYICRKKNLKMKSTILLIWQLNGVRSGNAGATGGGGGSIEPTPPPFCAPERECRGSWRGRGALDCIKGITVEQEGQ
jgi:hypothetical protein